MARAGSTWLGGRSGAPWGDPQPIRAEIFSAERFEDHARSLADSHTIAKHAERVVPLLTRLRADMAALTKSYEAIADDVQQGREITPAAEWLLDNFHAVETHVRQIRLDLSPDYFGELPKLGPGFLSGHPRIFALMWGFVAHTDSLIEPDLLSRYVRAYETRKALTLGELWAVAITLRLLLVENLRRVADLVVTAGRDRAAADTAADRLLGLDSANGLTPDLLPPQRLASRAFTARLLQRLRGLENTEVREWLQSRVDTGQGEALMVAEAHSQSAAVVTVRNIFTSLRLITDMNWEDWLESVSLIEEELRTHEGYLALDFPTRNLNRSAIEDLARRSGQEEIDVARAALQRARFAPPGPGRDVGFWLFDRGRAEFQKAIDYRPTLRRRLVDLVRRLGLPGYLTAGGGGPPPRRAARLRRAGHHIRPARPHLAVLAADRAPGSGHRPRGERLRRHRRQLLDLPAGLRPAPAQPRAARRGAGGVADPRRHPGHAVLGRGGRRVGRAAGGPPPRQPGRGALLRARRRLAGCPRTYGRGRPGAAGSGAPAHRRPERRTRRPFPALPPPAPLQPGRRRLDGLGTQTRQTRRTQCAAARSGQRPDGRRGPAAWPVPLCHQPRQRHPAAAGGGPPAHRQTRPPAQPGPPASLGPVRLPRLRHTAAPHHPGPADGRGQFAAAAHLLHPPRRRPVRLRRLRRLPGPLRAGLVHRQGDLRHRHRRSPDHPPHPREPRPEP
ncbi:hypothetical protein BN11_800002 [Nostocoides australiense Ben110]|uniref:Uncharacterized protein n=1 Tax=Nostocoides australiense Ben110 TaxID=1193182 RepID=W6K220_9MICO|nr:hypothetical protein BN11_800002 [Tetrasphaera australiensis Ben110]